MKNMMRIVGTALALGAFSPATQAQTASNVTLKMASFGGPFGEAMQKYAIDLFTRRTGIKVEVSYANPEDFLAKLIASRGRAAPYDVLALDDDVTAQAIGAGVLQKLDPKIVTNLKYLYPEALNKQGYGPALYIFSFGIAYNKEKLKQAHIPYPKSWQDLWDPRLANHVSIPDLANIQGRDLLIETAKMNSGNESNVGKAIAKIGQIKAQSYYVASSTLYAQLASGDVWVAPWNNMRAEAMADRRLPIGYVIPKQGGIGNTDTIQLAAGSQHPKEAQMLINYILSPFAELGMSQLLPTAPSNRLLAAVVAADFKLRSETPATAKERRALYFPDWAKFNAQLKRADDLWDRMKAR